jgi:hemoglobin
MDPTHATHATDANPHGAPDRRRLGAGLCTEAEVTALVHSFYDRVRADPVLGPIFNGHIHDWDRHLENLADFWSSMLRRTGRFTGAPMPKHVVLPDLSAELFQRWLRLFNENAAQQPNRAMADQACATARRIAQSLWLGYQINRDPSGIPKDLPHA